MHLLCECANDKQSRMSRLEGVLLLLLQYGALGVALDCADHVQVVAGHV